MTDKNTTWEPKTNPDKNTPQDLIEALAMSEALTTALKYTTRRERPDGSGKTSFPSGHAADTFAFATALESHLNWRYSVPAYIFASTSPPRVWPPIATG